MNGLNHELYVPLLSLIHTYNQKVCEEVIYLEALLKPEEPSCPVAALLSVLTKHSLDAEFIQMFFWDSSVSFCPHEVSLSNTIINAQSVLLPQLTCFL